MSAPAVAALPAANGPAPPKKASPEELASAQAAGAEFEAMFLSQMLDHMFAGIGTEGLFGGGAGEDTYRGMLNEQYGKVIAKNGGIGLADAVTREILRMQEAQP